VHRAAHYGYSLLVAIAECHTVRMLYRCVASWPTDCPSSMGLRTRKACTNELRASPFALCVVSGGSKVRWLRGSSASAPGPVASSTRLISPPKQKPIRRHLVWITRGRVVCSAGLAALAALASMGSPRHPPMVEFCAAYVYIGQYIIYPTIYP